MNPELKEQLELERLIAEQEKDDSAVVYGEKGHEHDLSIDGMENNITLDEEGEIVVSLPRERGSVLIGSASYHGTLTGYRKEKCRCPRCTAAHREHQREYIRGHRAKQREERQQEAIDG